MVLSSISPLFILWAIRGNSLIPDRWFIGLCVLMFMVPNAFLCLRIRTAKKQADKRVIAVGKADDHRDHLLVYLFAMLLPFYAQDVGNWRDLWATLAALAFVVFLFWHLNLHYMNLIFAMYGYRVFTIYPPIDGNFLTDKMPLVLITRRVNIASGERIVAYRLSNTVYLEVES
jgi:hypothetical protein